MSYVDYSSTSPYATTKQAPWHIGLYKHRHLRAHKGDREIVIGIKYNFRPDLLSFDLYGTPVYWWVFCVRNINVIRDPVWDFEAGKVIMVPTVEHLKSVVG
jgi:hypothetical protein